MKLTDKEFEFIEKIFVIFPLFLICFPFWLIFKLIIFTWDYWQDFFADDF